MDSPIADPAGPLPPRRVSGRQLFQLLRRAVQGWIDDKAASMGAALAYYTLFSLAPVLLIALSVAGFVFGAEAAQGAVFAQLRGLVGEGGAAAVEQLLRSVDRPGGGIVATALGLGLMLVGATTVFAELQDALDRIWRAPARPAGGLWALLRARVLSFGLILGLGFLLLVSMLFSAALAALQHWWGFWLADWRWLLQGLNQVSGFVLVTLMFALIYKLMPRVRVPWADVWVGAVVTAALFSVGRSLIGAYLATGAVGSGFGAAGSLVAVLVWVYYSAQIFLFGAEFTWAYAHTLGSRRDKPLPPPTVPAAPPPNPTTISAPEPR